MQAGMGLLKVGTVKLKDRFKKNKKKHTQRDGQQNTDKMIV